MSPARCERTVGCLINAGFEVQAKCPVCRRCTKVDLQKLLEIKGPDYLLWNKRAHCRKKGCTGQVKFYVGPGWYTQMWDDRTELRWINEGR